MIDSLKALHPQASEEVPELPENAPKIRADPDLLQRALKRLANGAAPAGSGWTGELLQSLAADTDCYVGIECIVNDILNGDLSSELRDVILASVLVVAAKSSGGVRPIAMGEVFYKLAGLYALVRYVVI